MNVYIPSSLHAVGDENVAHLSLPSLEQPTHVGQESSPVEGDAFMFDISPEPIVPGVPLQEVVPQPQPEPEADTPLEQNVCPFCEKSFKRMQELRRHLLSNLPHPFRCPSPNCSWSCSRPERLDKHINTQTHLDIDPGHKIESQLYNPEWLVDWMLDGTMDVVSAAGFALSLAKEKLAELGVASVEMTMWSKRRKFCTERRRSVH